LSSAPRGLAPREGLELVLMKMGRARPPFEPRRRPQAGKSGDPRSQNADSSPRAQGAPGLGRAERRKGKCEASRALTACGLGHCVAVDWTWVALFPHASLFYAMLGRLVAAHSRSPFCCSSALCPFSSRTPVSTSNPILNLPSPLLLPWLRRRREEGRSPCRRLAHRRWWPPPSTGRS